jgi:CRISPR system Cascade subunit CasA
MPNSDLYDELNICDQVLADVIEAGWVERIANEVELTKNVIEETFRDLLRRIEFIRGARKDMKADSKADEKSKGIIQEVYFEIDEPFRQWIAGILPGDRMESKVQKWRQTLKDVILKQAEKLLKNASNRDYIGRENEKEIENIATAYNRFKYYLNKQL